GAGVAPVPALLRSGAAVALGSDGASSNDNQNMWETLKMAALLPRAYEDRDAWPGALTVLDMCWDGGARAMGAPLGRVAPGHRADLVLLRAGEVFVAPKEQVAYQLAYGDMNHAVDTVLVDGTPVVRDGKVTTVDVDALLDEAAALAARIWEGLPERMKNYEQTAPLLQRLENEVRRRPWSRATGMCRPRLARAPRKSRGKGRRRPRIRRRWRPAPAPPSFAGPGPPARRASPTGRGPPPPPPKTALRPARRRPRPTAPPGPARTSGGPCSPRRAGAGGSGCRGRP